MVDGAFVVNAVKEQITFGADSTTVTIPLPRANYLQGIRIRVENTNGSTSNTAETIEGDVDKIELVADGTVVLSVTGEECRKFAQFDMGDLPPMNETQVGSEVQWAVFPFKFGRDDFDKDLILPAHMFKTLDLKITVSFSDSTTVGYTTSETNAKYDVFCRYLVSNERAQTAFLTERGVYAKTVSSTGTEEVDLPIGAGNGSYRRILFMVYEASIEDGTDVDTYEVLLNDSQRLIDERWDTSQLEDAIRYRCKTTKKHKIYVVNGETENYKVARINAPLATNTGCCGIIAAQVRTGDAVTYYVTNPSGGIVAAQNINAEVVGSGASYATMIDFGTDRITDSVRVSGNAGVSSLKIRYNQNAAGSTNRVVAEQVVAF